MKYAEVIGDPIKHSKSPLIHGFWLKALGLDGEYRATHVMPEGLAERIALFRRSGQLFRHGEELFTEVGWLQVMIGQGIEPQAYHPAADALPAAELQGFLGNMRTLIQRAAATFPEHARFVATHCRAPS